MHINLLRFFRSKYLLLITILFMLSACKPQLDKEEAERHLRAFDNELINLVQSIRKTPAIRVLNEMMAIEGLPLPGIIQQRGTPVEPMPFSFEAHKGIYNYDSLSGSFIRTQAADSIIIRYNKNDEANQKVLLIISRFREETGTSNLLIPVELHASMYINDRLSLKLVHDAQLEQGIPVEGHTSITVDRYTLEATLSTKLRRSYANAHIEIHAWRGSKKALTWHTRSKVGINPPGALYLKKTKIDFELFPLQIRAKVKHEAVKPDTRDFIEAYNKHSRIELFRTRDGRKLGDIRLQAHESSDKLDYAFYYKDGSFIYVEDLLLSANEILNLKKF